MRRGPARLAAGAAAVLTAVAALTLLVASPASAHAYIVSATPAEGSVVGGTPKRVTLVFDESILDLGRNAIAVTGPRGRPVTTACATVDGRELSVPVRLAGTGTYRVTWRATSADGHLVGDSYAFRYRAPAGAPATTPAAAPSCAPVAATAAPASGPSGALVLAIVVSGVALLAVLVVAAVVLVAVRRADRAADGPGGAEPGDAGSPP